MKKEKRKYIDPKNLKIYKIVTCDVVEWIKNQEDLISIYSKDIIEENKRHEKKIKKINDKIIQLKEELEHVRSQEV